jgi:hypothetical protein
MLLGLLREGLVSQLSHAGYVVAELARAEPIVEVLWIDSGGTHAGRTAKPKSETLRRAQQRCAVN